MVQRFRREARIALSIIHPNVVRAYDAGDAEGRLFIASEVIRGGSLARLLRSAGPLPERLAMSIFRDLVAGLGALHDRGLIHRDLKPQNALMGLSGLVHVADFGLARPTSPDRSKYTRTATVMGTPKYVAPEQVEPSLADGLDIRMDLYAAGIILYECLAGDAPFTGRPRVRVLSEHVRAPVPDVRDVVPSVTAETAELIQSLLQKRPDARPASPRIVLDQVSDVFPRIAEDGGPGLAARLMPSHEPVAIADEAPSSVCVTARFARASAEPTVRLDRPRLADLRSEESDV